MQQRVNHKKDFLEKINKASLKFLTPLTPKETYATIVKEALKLIDGKDGLITLKDGRSLKKVYASSPEIDIIPMRKKGFMYTSAMKSKVFSMNKTDIQSSHPEVLKQGIKSNLLIPLSYHKNTIGVLMIRFTFTIQFTQEELEILQLFGSMASLAIKKTQLYAETKKALETRDLFIALASHELKTPLTSINLYSQFLHAQLEKENHPAKKWSEKLALESNRLALLTEELLEVNQIKTGQFKYEWRMCEILEIIKRAIANTNVLYPHISIVLHTSLKKREGLLLGDFNKLIQVLINVLNNAAKFSKDDREVIVKLYFNKPQYEIHISDRGPGIPSQALTKIFDRFYKVSDNYEEGMGLGLFLTKKIIEDHKGEIHILSELEKGTTVIIRLPEK